MVLARQNETFGVGMSRIEEIDFRDFVDRNGRTVTVKVGDGVRYIPLHAHGDLSHKDVEYGQVTSWNKRNIFVRYRKQHPSAPGQATNPNDLELA
jgi:hypothetical protein